MVLLNIKNVHHELGSNQSVEIYKKAIECAKTFDWEEYPTDGADPDLWPRRFRCKKTGLIAIKTSCDSPVMYLNDSDPSNLANLNKICTKTNHKLLLLNSDEVIIRDIIK
jgi:hypothetical protein